MEDDELDEATKSTVYRMIKGTNARVKMLNEWHSDVNIDLSVIKNDISWLKKVVPISAIVGGLINIIYSLLKGA